LRTSSGWSQLLSQIHAIHNSEDPGYTKVFYGLVDFYSADGCPGSCQVGLGYLGTPTAVGFSGWGSGTNEASETLTHEIGHNFNRQHAPCGNPAGPDPNWPTSYTNASIGQWGFDNATSQLYSPTTYYDYMSYCSPAWTSDYTYKGIFDFHQNSTFNVASPEIQSPALYIGGSIDSKNNVTLLPVFTQNAPLTEDKNSPYRVDLLDSTNKIVQSVHFVPNEIPDSKDQKGINVFVPYIKGVTTVRVYNGTKLIFEKRASGVKPSLSATNGQLRRTWKTGLTYNWNLTSGTASKTSYRIRFSPDKGKTWKVLSLYSASQQISLDSNEVSKSPNPILEVEAMDGVQTDTLIYDLNTGQVQHP
jgi:hypothetical protein